MNNKNNIVILCGKSASGKDTIARILEKEYDYNFVISTTTRPIRPGESEKNPYYFVNNDAFKKLINDNKLIEYREYHTLVNNNPDIWFYGVEEKEIDPNKKYVVVLDIVGLKEFNKYFKERITSFYLDVDDKTRRDRCMSRGDYDESEFNRRLIDDEKVFSSEIIDTNVDYIVHTYDKFEIVDFINAVIND